MRHFRNMRLEIHRGLIGLEKIETEWCELFNKLSSPKFSQSIIWHKAYLNHLITDLERCYFFCIYKEESLIGIFPLEAVRRKFYLLRFNTLCFSDHNHFGLSSIIVDEREKVQYVFQFLYEALKKKKSIDWDIIFIYRAIQNSQIEHCKVNNNKFKVESQGVVCHTLPLTSFDLIFENFSRKFKRNLRKGNRMISDFENFEYKSIREPEQLEKYFGHFLDIEASGWKGSTGTNSAIKQNNNLKNFYEEIMLGFSKNGQMEINVLKINDITAAVQFAIILEPTVFLLKVGYDENFRSLSLGNLIIEHKLKEYESDPNLTILNFVSGATWVKPWKPTILLSYDIYNCRNRMLAIYIRSILWLRDRAKEVIFKLEKGVFYIPYKRKISSKEKC